ncbi:hypothetical protein HPB48_011507 [Haemaphysalis longicornis]|uniref:Uncharacterized protein n=1 Tax=Haemaphysalis longicornis TaxID=44386 RepID=A0A9J6G3Q7_HAELO|nr:hypothetical protein HPB48_011507 [Haemaphysalis longicornis]
MAGAGDAPSPPAKTEAKNGSFITSILNFFIVVTCLTIIGTLLFLLIYGERAELLYRESMKQRLCEAADCAQVARIMRLGPVTGSLPCKDFYSYVCTPWAEANAKGVDASWLSSQSYVEKLQADMRLRAPNVTHQTVLDMVLITYQSCLNSVKEPLGPEMKKVFDKFHIGNWPNFAYTDVESYNVFNEIMNLDMIGGMQVVFIFENAMVGESVLRRRRSIQASPFICPYAPGSDNDVKHSYEAYVQKALELFDYKDNAAAKEVAGIHLKLCDASKADGDTYTLHAFDEIVSSTRDLGVSESDWKNSLEAMGTITPGTQFHTKLSYIKEALMHLIKAEAPEKVMRFVGFSILAQIAAAQEDFLKLRNEYFYLDHPVARIPVQVDSCLAFIITHFMEAWNVYVLSSANTKKEVSKDVSNLVASIKSSMLQRVRNTPWMDELSKSRTFEKLARTTVVPPVVGAYLRTFNLTDKYATLDALSPVDYYGNQLKIRANNAGYNIRGTKRNLGERNQAIAGGDARPSLNMVHVYAGLLQLPFYSLDVPLAIKYGGIGTLTGRQLAFLLTGKSVKKDATGSAKSWWSGQVYQEYKRRAMCFARQANLSAAVGDEPNHLVDYLGARIALDAFLDAKADRKRRLLLPDVPLSDEQLFFIAFCHAMCASVEVDGQLMLPVTALKRCNGAVMNMPEFAKAFHCNSSADSNDAILNPAYKCRLY